MKIFRLAGPMALVAGVAAATPAGATDIYTWVDETGAVNYSTTEPEDVKARVFKGSKAGVPTPIRTQPAQVTQEPDRQLAERINKLEADLNKERDARFAMLERQLDQQREETRRLQKDRVLDAYGPTQPAYWAPDIIYVVPGHVVTKKHHGPKKPMAASEPFIGYPPLSAMPSFRSK